MTDSSRRTGHETREIPAFSSVHMSGAGRLILRRGERHHLALRGPTEMLARVVTEVRGDQLVIRHRPTWWIAPWMRTLRGRGVEAMVTAPTLSGVHVSGAVAVVAEPIVTPGALTLHLTGATRAAVEAITALRLDLSISGAGRADVAAMKTHDTAISISGSGRLRLAGVSGDALRLSISGAAKVEAAGTLRSLDVTMSGAGEVAASSLRCETIALKLSGTGRAELWATDRLGVHASGAGKVTYRGSPALHQRITGTASVQAQRS